MRVLVADDDDILRMFFERVVSSLGHDVQKAPDGEAAWAAFERCPPDVVISDWVMPGIDGPELTRRIRAHVREDGYTYVMLVTALSERHHVGTALEAGADDYLVKPVDADDLRLRLIVAARITELHRHLGVQRAELAELNEELGRAARRDELTRLGNRMRLNEDLAAAASRMVRHGEPAAVALFDVDHFKAYNDRHGHVAGDAVLRAVGAAIRNSIRLDEQVYRYGGEEFLVLFAPGDLEEACRAAERVRAAVRDLAIPHEAAAAGIVTVSGGVAASAPGSDEVERLVDRADEALYRAKAAGRDRVEVDR